MTRSSSLQWQKKKFEIKVDNEFLVTIMRTSSLPQQLLFKSLNKQPTSVGTWFLGSF